MGDFDDFSCLDYPTNSKMPLDVAYSWHVSVMILALLGKDTESRGFQLLTQQYCFLLELAGFWEWSLYVALFIADRRARSLLIRGLLLRNSASTSGQDLRVVIERQPVELPWTWWWRCHALRSESSQDWFDAVAGWLICRDAERAAVIAVGYLQCPLMVSHTSAPFQRGAAEAVSFAPMSDAGRWLLAVLEELEGSMSSLDEAAADVCRRALRFLQDWSRGSARGHEPSAVAQLHWRCVAVRQCLLGMPW